jgi:hypothetical protein
MLKTHLHSLPSEILIAILLYCDVRTLAALLRASAICWRLPCIPHRFGAKRQVIIALDRIRSERLKSPYYYNTKAPAGLDYWSDEEKAWNALCSATIDIPNGRLCWKENVFEDCVAIGFDKHDACLDAKCVVFNEHNDTNGFCLLALHSNEVMFPKGFDYANGEDGFPQNHEFWHPPRGRLPFGRKWNYTLGGYL